MKIQKLKNIIRLKSLVALMLVALVLVGVITIPRVRADQYDDKIKALQQQNAQNAQQAKQLQIQATSYQDTINKLQDQINNVQKQITVNQAKQADLEKQIAVAEAELTKQKRVLGENIKAMYLEGQITTLEMLASSKDLSEFVDKQQYRNSVKDKIKTTLDTINELKNKLRDQKTQVEQAIKDQQSMQDQLDSSKSEQNQLLGLTQQQKAEFDQKIKETNGQIASLRSQQAAENARLFNGANVVLGSACDTSHGDTYPAPWCSSPQDSMFDYWGMYNRECVSYTAWKVSESGRHMPYWGGIGNAWEWAFSGWVNPGDGSQSYTNNGRWHVGNAQAAGIPVDGTPRAGDVAIKNGPYGHAMYVESVNGDGTINISQYNADLAGHFSRVFNFNYRSYGLLFIHF